MKKISRNHSGFSAIELIISIAIVGLVVFIGWYIFNKKDSGADSNNSSSKTSAPVKPEIKEITPENFTITFVKNYKNISSLKDAELKAKAIQALDKMVTTDAIEQIQKVLVENDLKANKNFYDECVALDIFCDGQIKQGDFSQKPKITDYTNPVTKKTGKNLIYTYKTSDKSSSSTGTTTISLVKNETTWLFDSIGVTSDSNAQIDANLSTN